MLACALGLMPLGANSLSYRAGYTESTLSDTCFDTQLTFTHEALTTGVRFHSEPTWQAALSWNDTIGKYGVWEAKGDALMDEYGSVLDGESSIGLGGSFKHLYGGMTFGLHHMLRFHNDMDKPLCNLNFAMHAWIGAKYGPLDCKFAWDSSTLFLYSYQWFSPILSLTVGYQLNDAWVISLIGATRIADAAPNELVSFTLAHFSAVITRRF